MNLRFIKTLLAVACLASLTSAQAGPTPPEHVYPNGFSVVLKLGNDLYEVLDEKFQKSLLADPVAMGEMDTPVITPAITDDGNQKLGQVIMSVGFIDLINHVAHAKAIDRIQPGYFEQYILNLGSGTADGSVPEVANIVDPRYWSQDIMNDQITYFNQMMGMELAINFSHHYLGYYSQFSSQMLSGKLVPINNLLPPDAWDMAVKAATLNCLNGALSTTGPQALFEAIDKMPKRPTWTAFLVPPHADLKKLNKQLSDYEAKYFKGGLTLNVPDRTASK